MSTTLSNIKHISLDFWNTLATPNKEYANARNWAIVRAANIGHLTTAQQKYTATKKFLDTAAELTGFGTTTENCWKILNKQLGKPLESIDALAAECVELFVANPPTVPDALPGLLAQIKARGIGLNILSNTNFIPGEVLRSMVIEPIFGEDLFDFMMFSDEWEMAKPSTEFFSAACRHAVLGNLALKREHIVHIGDNFITDVTGAEHVGIQGLHVTDPADLVRLLQGLLDE